MMEVWGSQLSVQQSPLWWVLGCPNCQCFPFHLRPPQNPPGPGPPAAFSFLTPLSPHACCWNIIWIQLYRVWDEYTSKWLLLLWLLRNEKWKMFLYIIFGGNKTWVWNNKWRKRNEESLKFKTLWWILLFLFLPIEKHAVKYFFCLLIISSLLQSLSWSMSPSGTTAAYKLFLLRNWFFFPWITATKYKNTKSTDKPAASVCHRGNAAPCWSHIIIYNVSMLHDQTSEISPELLNVLRSLRSQLVWMHSSLPQRPGAH